MKLAIVGATGLVGRTMLRVLEERDVAIDTLVPLASKRSAGSTITFKGQNYVVEELTHDSFDGLDYALFSAGGSTSRAYAPSAAKAGCVVIDNSSAWRMDPYVPLVVPEVNADDVRDHHNIIANPNCSTIQMVVALKPLHDVFGLQRIVVSTYQSPSGAGQKGVDQLMGELENRRVDEPISPHPLAFSTVFHTLDPETGWTDEEVKMMRETRRIMHLPDLPVTVTCVRVPVLGGHSESVYIETEREASLSDVIHIMKEAPGVVYVDPTSAMEYPTPQSVKDTDPVYVGRIRKDPSTPNGLLLWVVADNLRKGAATNAVQILELLMMETA